MLNKTTSPNGSSQVPRTGSGRQVKRTRHGHHPLSPSSPTFFPSRGAAVVPSINRLLPPTPKELLQTVQMPFGDTTDGPLETQPTSLSMVADYPTPLQKKNLKPAAIGCCKALGRKVGNQWIKPAYPELDEYNVNVQLKELLKNSFVEIVWGDMLLNDLRETPYPLL